MLSAGRVWAVANFPIGGLGESSVAAERPKGPQTRKSHDSSRPNYGVTVARLGILSRTEPHRGGAGPYLRLGSWQSGSTSNQPSFSRHRMGTRLPGMRKIRAIAPAKATLMATHGVTGSASP